MAAGADAAPKIGGDGVGRGWRVRLVNGSAREGFVYAVDPALGHVLMITKPPEENKGEAPQREWGLSVLFQGSISRAEEIDLGGPQAFAQAVRAHPKLLVSSSDPGGGGGAGEAGVRGVAAGPELLERKERVVELLKKVPIPSQPSPSGQSGEQQHVSPAGGLLLAPCKSHGAGSPPTLLTSPQHRLDVAGVCLTDASPVVLMGGLVRIDAPFVEDSCASSNEKVLQHVMDLLRGMGGGATRP